MFIEVNRFLGKSQEDKVDVSRWASSLLSLLDENPHIGNMYVDLALITTSKQMLTINSYSSHLLTRLPSGESALHFPSDRQNVRNQIPVEVNLLADEYAITGKQYRIQNVQDMQPRKVRGVDFETSENFTIRRMLLGGGEDTVEVQVASIRSFLVMRRVAIKVRLKEKVAWNIYFCIRYYPDGVDLLIQDLQLLFRQGLV